MRSNSSTKSPSNNPHPPAVVQTDIDSHWSLETIAAPTARGVTWSDGEAVYTYRYGKGTSSLARHGRAERC